MDINKELLEILPGLPLLKKEVTKDIRLEEDLYMYGDVAAEFLHDYSVRFDVDVSNFDFRIYFTTEGLRICYFLH